MIGALDSNTVDFTAPTRFLLVGYSHGMRTQFAEAAKPAAVRYCEGGWGEQIVFVASPDVEGMADAAVLAKYDVKVVFDDEATRFAAGWLLRYLANFRAIAGLEFFGHSSFYSLGFEEGSTRLSTSTPAGPVEALRGRFLPGDYVALRGCNSGAELAPFLSGAWRVPVVAALTGTNFQRLHSNGRWCFNDPGLFPAGGCASGNAVSFATPVPCSRAACLRMKPENAGYRGFWGTYEAGLGFYKTFCAVGVGDTSCAVGAANLLLATPTHVPLTSRSSWEDVERATLDSLCSNPADDRKRNECFLSLRTAAFGSGSYSPFRATTLKCDVRGCAQTDACESDARGAPIPGTCVRRAPANPEPREYVEEMRLVLAGFAALKGTGSPAPAPRFP